MTSHNLKILLSMAAAFVVMGISAMAFAQGEVFSAEQLAQIANTSNRRIERVNQSRKPDPGAQRKDDTKEND